MTWGYSLEAFKRLRKITSLPNISETNEKPHTESAIPIVPSTIALNFTNTAPLSPVTTLTPLTVNTSGRTFSLVSTNSPNSPANILLITTSASMLTGSQTILTSLASPILPVSMSFDKYYNDVNQEMHQ